MRIQNRLINQDSKPFIIAEMSGNHNRSLERAMEIVKAAADAGAHAVKLQTYTPDSLTIDCKGGLFDINDSKSLWYGRNLYDLYQEARTPYEWHKPLFDYAKDLGILIFSTPFDEEGVDLLEELGAPAHKIASFENNHYPLLRKIAKTGKPVIMSTGVISLSDLAGSVAWLREQGNTELALLKCTSTYPSTPENTNLRTIPHMRELFQCETGLSDHTMGIGAAVAATALGATIIEKHFCLSRAEGGVDSAFSLEPAEMKALVTETERAWQSLGHIQYGIQEAELKSLNYKRSVYVIKDVAEGEAFTTENLGIIRPGDGMQPKFLEEVLGKHAKGTLKRGMPLNWKLIS
ncbi:MAG: pseudaminic acid synthase [Chitinophagaceae bacterium]